MTPTLQIDMTQFQAAARELGMTAKWKGKNWANQLAFDTINYWFEETPPPASEVEAKRLRIKRYLTEPVKGATLKRWTKRLKNKAGEVIVTPRNNDRFRRVSKVGKGFRRARNLVFQRVHKIIQARRAKRGAPGLYGRAMLHQSGWFKTAAQNSVGYLKLPLIDAINALQRVVKFKRKAWGVGRIARWATPSAKGTATPAVAGNTAVATVQWIGTVGDSQAVRVNAILTNAFRRAVQTKTDKMKRDLARQIQPELDKHNAGKGGLGSGIIGRAGFIDAMVARKGR